MAGQQMLRAPANGVDAVVLDPSDLKAIRQQAKAKGSLRYKGAMESLANLLGLARSNALGRMDEFVQSEMDMRDFTLQRRLQIVDTGDYVNFNQDANKLKLFSVLSATPQPTNQPAGEVAAYSLLKIFASTKVSAETFEEILNGLGVRLRYNDGREPWEFPLRDCLKTGIRNPNAGTAASDDSVVEGTETEVIELGREQKLWGNSGEDVLVVLPGDGQTNLELFWLTDYAASPPAQPAGGEAGDIDLTVEVSGKLWKSIKRR